MKERAATGYAPIAVSAESTVVSEFIPDGGQGTGYQSEAELEREFIKLLESQAYEYLPITSEAQLKANLDAARAGRSMKCAASYQRYARSM